MVANHKKKKTFLVDRQASHSTPETAKDSRNLPQNLPLRTAQNAPTLGVNMQGLSEGSQGMATKCRVLSLLYIYIYIYTYLR